MLVSQQCTHHFTWRPFVQKVISCTTTVLDPLIRTQKETIKRRRSTKLSRIKRRNIDHALIKDKHGNHVASSHGSVAITGGFSGSPLPSSSYQLVLGISALGLAPSRNVSDIHLPRVRCPR